MVGSCRRKDQRAIEGLAAIDAGHQLGSDASKCECLGFEAESKQGARGGGHGIEQADGHVQQAEQLWFWMVFSGELAADIDAVCEQRESLEV
jgi:hypothetical protein